MTRKKSLFYNDNLHKTIFWISLGFLAASLGLTLYANAEENSKSDGTVMGLENKIQYVRSIKFDNGSSLSWITDGGKTFLSISSAISMGNSAWWTKWNVIYGKGNHNVANAKNVVIFWWEGGNTASDTAVILWWKDNVITWWISLGGSQNKGENAIIFWGGNNTAESWTFLLGGENIHWGKDNTIFGDNVTMGSNTTWNFVFSDGTWNFSPEGTDTFFLDVKNGLGIDKYGEAWVTVSVWWAIKVEESNSIWEPKREWCNHDHIGAIIYYSGCMCACNGDFFESLENLSGTWDAEKCTRYCNNNNIMINPELQVTYDLAGWIGNFPTQSFEKGRNNPKIHTWNPTKTWYTFSQWIENGGAWHKPWDELSSETSHSLTAQWSVQYYKCNAWQYLKKGATSCSLCEKNSFCPGNTTVWYPFNATSDQWINSCPTSYPNSVTGQSSINNCYLTLQAKYWVPTAGQWQKACPSDTYHNGGVNVYYHQTNSCTSCGTWTKWACTSSLLWSRSRTPWNASQCSSTKTEGSCYFTTTLKFNSDGWSAVSDKDCNYGTTTCTLQSAPTKAWYTFKGRKYNGTTYAAWANVADLIDGIKGSINFVAQWEANPIYWVCWSSHYSCSAWNSTNNVNGSTSYTWTCAWINWWTSKSCTENKVIDWVCWSSHYNCTAWTSTNNVNGSTSYTWTCAWINWWTPKSCSENKVIDWACWSSHYSCSAWTSTNNVNGSTSYTWTCAWINWWSSKSCTENKVIFQANICTSPASLSCSNWITFTVVKGTTYKDALTGHNYTSFICYTNSEWTSVLNTELAENWSKIYCKFGTRGGNANTQTSCSDTIPTMQCTSTNKGDYYFDWRCTFSHKVCWSYYSAKVDNQLWQWPAAWINRSATYTNRSMYGTLNGITCKYCSYDGREPCISWTFDSNNECTPS